MMRLDAEYCLSADKARSDRIRRLLDDVSEQTQALADRTRVAFERSVRKREHFDCSRRTLDSSLRKQRQTEKMYESSLETIRQSKRLLVALRGRDPDCVVVPSE
jgi:hypothetical protein